jgi:hypothetical protein
MKNVLLHLLGLLFISSLLQAQSAGAPIFEASVVQSIEPSRTAVLDQQINQYEIVELDIQQLSRHVKSLDSGAEFQLQLANRAPLHFTIELNDMRAPNYRAIATTELGEMNLERAPCNTYKGVVNGNSEYITRLTIKKNEVIGYFRDGEHEWFIEPLSRFMGEEVPKKHFVVYKIEDIKDVPGGHCGVTEMEEIRDHLNLTEPGVPLRTTPDCPSLLELATDADWEWFQMYGANSNAEILTNLNMVEGVYFSTFNMQFSIVFQNVWQTSADPYTAAGPPSSDILPEIRDEWENNNPTFMAVERDLMHLFSAKDHGTLFGSVNGGLPAVCSDPSVAHGFTADRVGAFLTTAHEIGHNFNGVHADGSGCGAAGASIMCQGQKSLFFSAASCTTISTYINNNSGCIVNDGTVPDALCQDVTIQLDGSGNASVTAAQVNNGSLDGCGFAVPTSVAPSSFNCSDVGGNTVTLTVTNAGNVTANCNATVTVEDNVAPDAQCQNVTIQLNASGNASTSAAAVNNNSSDACGIATTSLSKTSFDCGDTGPNAVTLTVTDVNGNMNTCNATVTVEDNIPPTVFCIDKIVEIQPDGMYTLLLSDVFDAGSSFDNCSIDQVGFPPTVFDCDDVDLTFPILVTATDPSGNSSNCTANITVKIGKALPAPWMTADIGIVTLGNEYCFDPCTGPTPADGEFTITGSGNNATSSSTDNVAYAYQSVCGDKMITAKVESVTPDGYGGLMIRETLADGSKQISLFSNLTNILRHETRYTTNGPKQVNSFYKPVPIWLRLMRQGNWIFAYYSTNGLHFQYVHGVHVPMQNCIEIGLASFTYLPDNQTAAVFSFVSVENSTGLMFAIQEGSPEMKMMRMVENKQLTLEQVPYPLAEIQDRAVVFPNPAAHRLNVQFTEPVRQATRLVLYNQFGQPVGQKQMQAGNRQLEWDVSRLSGGVYFLNVWYDDEHQQVLRVVIQGTP